MKMSRCIYENCRLPENNNKFLWQLGYLGISILYLLFVPGQFTCYAVIMFTLPVILDLKSMDFTGTGLKLLKKAYIILNGLTIVFGIIGTLGGFNDTGTTYRIADEALFFSGVQFSKQIIAVPLIADIAVPLVLFLGMPCKKQMVEVMQYEQFSKMKG